MKITSQEHLSRPQQPNRAHSAREAARQFESMFVSTMLRSMRKTVGEGGLIPSSLGEKIYTGMLDQEYAQLMSKHAGLGLTDLILEQIGTDQSTSSSEMLRDMRNPAWMIDNRFVPSATARHNALPSPEALRDRVSRWDGMIDEASSTFGVDRHLIAAVIAQESAGNPHAVSSAGAKGLMQLMDGTAREVGTTNAFSPRQNIEGGTRYLRSLLERFENNKELALASYNAGPSAVEKYQGIPPYRETQQYVRNVLHLRNSFMQMTQE